MDYSEREREFFGHLSAILTTIGRRARARTVPAVFFPRFLLRRYLFVGRRLFHFSLFFFLFETRIGAAGRMPESSSEASISMILNYLIKG